MLLTNIMKRYAVPIITATQLTVLLFCGIIPGKGGVQRSGKSTILKMIAGELRERGVAAD
jgi:ABC-type Na+ transport system ATPase subunit NatA